MSAWFGSFFSGLWLDVQRSFFAAQEADTRAAAIERLLALPAGARVLDFTTEAPLSPSSRRALVLATK